MTVNYLIVGHTREGIGSEINENSAIYLSKDNNLNIYKAVNGMTTTYTKAMHNKHTRRKLSEELRREFFYHATSGRDLCKTIATQYAS